MVKRHISAFVKQSLQDFPAVLINGARQVGKSTLAQQLCNEGVLVKYITLDDLSQLEAARNDPHGFINNISEPIAIDEIQRAPELLQAIKKSIDENRRPGRFLLTGSANIFSYPGVSESLAGRIDVIPLEGLSIGEILQQEGPSPFLTDLFAGLTVKELKDKWDQNLRDKSSLPLQMFQEMVFYGGYPEIALKKQLRFKERWFSSYQTAYIERDVRDISKFMDIIAFTKLFRLLGLQTGSLLNHKNLSVEVGLDQRTVARYLEILEMTFQTNLLTPWFSNIRKRLVKTPKIYLNDSGQASYFTGISDASSLVSSPYFGAIFETWVWSELRKLLAMTTGIGKCFYRTHLGKEVDFLLFRGSMFWGIECKAAETISRKDFKGLEDLQQALPSEDVKGIILYRGHEIIPFSHTLLAVPLQCLI